MESLKALLILRDAPDVNTLSLAQHLSCVSNYLSGYGAELLVKIDALEVRSFS
jgi:hypothetical protein